MVCKSRLKSYDEKQFIEINDKIVSLGNKISKKTKKILYLFYSGYRGMTFNYKDKKYIIFDQPGTVGLEDQTMPYISLTIDNKLILKFEPEYFDRQFGNVKMDEKMRDLAYKAILKYIKSEE